MSKQEKRNLLKAWDRVVRAFKSDRPYHPSIVVDLDNLRDFGFLHPMDVGYGK